MKSASAGPGAIVYEQFGSLGLYDLKTGKRSRVPVTVAADFPDVRERLLRVGPALTNGHLSPTGARAVFEAHGEIVTVPAEKGDPRNLTGTPGVMERDPAWSPDGKSIAYFSDEAGEYALHVRPQSGTGETIKVTLGEKPSIYFFPRWSPDSKRIAFIDSHQTLWLVDLDTRKPVRVDRTGSGADRATCCARRGRPTRSGSPTRSGCRTTWAPSSSTRSTAGRARRSPTG